ncbi:hypothetical protein BH23PLA1_BH23PLA1_42660 [soil metagenome]
MYRSERRFLAAFAACCLLVAPVVGDDEKPAAAGDLPLVFQADFEDGSLSGWEFTDPEAWRITEDDGNKVLDQHKNSRYEPPVRSPLNIGLIENLVVGDFVMDLKLRSTSRDYGHRDLCLFFGHQDPSHFYYVHLGKEADPHAHSVFLVDGEPRVSIARERTEGTPWTEGWHKLRIVRKVESGLIEVYFDDMDKPAMTANDKRFTQGRIGFGSFDDSGYFDEIRIWGITRDASE